MEKKTLEQIRGEFDKERIKEWDKTAMETYKQATQDTPEQKEEWEEELGKLMSTWGKVLLVNKGRIGAGMQTAMYLKFYHFIKNLLSEREREVLNGMREWVVEYHKDNWDIRDFDAEIAIGKIIDRELSKLKDNK
jgi:molybdopterin converting factor small subunit